MLLTTIRADEKERDLLMPVSIDMVSGEEATVASNPP